MEYLKQHHTCIARQNKQYLHSIAAKVKTIQAWAVTNYHPNDFETGMVSAFTKELPASKHYSHRIRKEIKSESVKNQYETDTKFALRLKLLPALGFIPAANVIDVFRILCVKNMLPYDAPSIQNYFMVTLIGRLQRRQHPPSPRFPHDTYVLLL